MQVFKIVFPDYPTKLPMTQGRRKIYFTKSDKLPKRLQTEDYIFKKERLYNAQTKEFVIKNERFVDVPRMQSLSYNKISTRLKIPVLIKLKDWMKPFMPAEIGFDGPYRVQAIVYDWAQPMHKDLDNMHIYYKAFLDLLKQRGMIKDDSKRYITEAGGFKFQPIAHKDDRKLVFIITKDIRPEITNHVMYNLQPKSVKRGTPLGVGLNVSERVEPGKVEVQSIESIGGIDHILQVNFGKTKVIKPNADKIFRNVFDYCVNNNTCVTVMEDFYRIHADRIERFLLSQGVQVIIKVK
jgi:Holliday junction resolvase RusA-like endonuclease